jgi:Family of unknown function (DUF5677)
LEGKDLTPLVVAEKLLAWVRGAAPGELGVETNDRNERLLVAAYGRAYRCFASIKELAARGEAQDAMILTRGLLSIVLRSIYLIHDDDPRERSRRFRQAGLTYAELETKYADEMKAAGLETGAEQLRSIAEHLRAEGVKALPDDRGIAKQLELDDFYTRIYRPGSEVSHYSIGTMLDGFLELTHDQIIGPVALDMPDPEKAENVLGMAALTYALFLHLSEKVIRHGLGSKARDLLAEAHSTWSDDDEVRASDPS